MTNPRFCFVLFCFSRYSWSEKRQDASFLPGWAIFTKFLIHFCVLSKIYRVYKKHFFGHYIAGSHMVFFILNVIEGIGVLLTFKPFLVEPQITK